MSVTDQLAPGTATPAGLDGLCVVGKLVAISEVRDRNGEVIDGLCNGVIQSTRGTTRIQVSAVSKQPTGDVELPAYEKLVFGKGRDWMVSLGIIPPRGDSTFTNFLAIDAAEL